MTDDVMQRKWRHLSFRVTDFMCASSSPGQSHLSGVNWFHIWSGNSSLLHRCSKD